MLPAVGLAWLGRLLMSILLAFAPFIVFAVVDRLVGPTEGLAAGALTSLALLVRDWPSPDRTPKLLEVGTALLFGGMALYAVLGDPGWSIMAVRLRVDAGLLVIVLITLAIGRPFTLQYAREKVPEAYWDSPEFLRANTVITAAWALAFLVMVIADLVLLYMPEVHSRVGVLATILALVGAIKFTAWYPEQAKRPATG
jgi:hypothetical protein